MDTQEIRDILSQKGPQGEQRREMFREMINQCYSENIKSLQEKATQKCSFALTYDILMNTDVFKDI